MTDSTIQPIFVGRQKELDKIGAIVGKLGKPWLVWVVAPAGAGKSKLVETVLETYGQPDYSAAFFDFFTDGLRTRPGILDELAERFGVTEGRFQEEQTRYQQAQGGQERSFALNQMEAALVEALREKFAAHKRGILVVDTVELVSPLRVSDWFFGQFLPQLAPHLVVIAAGRDTPERVESKLQKKRIGTRIELGGFTQAEAHDFLRQRLPTLQGLEADPYIRKLYNLTRGRGQALLLALVAEKLDDGSWSYDHLLSLSRKQMMKQLVEGPLLDETAEGRVLFILAHAYHGLDAAMLRRLMTPLQLGTEDYNTFVRQMSRFPFIKYQEAQEGREEDGNRYLIRLHDLFLELARDQVWRAQDPAGTLRRLISQKLAQHFEEAESQSSDAGRQHTPKSDRLIQQRLYHLLYADRERAYGALWQALDDAWHVNRQDFMDVLLKMAREVNGDKDLPRFDPILDRLEKAARVWMMQEDWTVPREAIADLADEVIAAAEYPRRLRLSAMAAKGMALGDTPQVDEANQLLWQAFYEYDELLDKAETAASDETVAAELWKNECGVATVEGICPERYLILNTIGYNERVRGNFPQALEAFERSYELSETEGDLRWQASAATQRGNMLRYEGKMPQAFDWIRRGLSLRRQLGVESQIAYGLVPLGRAQRDIHHLDEARKTFQDALAIWRQVDARRDMAAMLMELGWVETLAGNYDLAEKYFQEATQVSPPLIVDPSLKEKHGRLLLRRALAAPNESQRSRWLDKAESVLQEGVDIAGSRERQLYAALCLAALMRVADLRDDEGAVGARAAQLRALEAQRYEFNWAYAEMEETLGHRAFRRARQSDGQFDAEAFDNATDHYLRMFINLAKHSPLQYREKREFLREWLHELPESWRRRAGERLITGWLNENGLATQHPGFLETVRMACYLV